MDHKLTVSLSPHIHTQRTMSRDMWHVVIALMPALATAIWTFGAGAAAVTAVTVGVCLLTEWLIETFLFHRRGTLANGSALITGLLLAFNLPSILPLWMAAIGAVVAIGIGKMSFGGLGCNIWNPALVGRVFLLLSFPAAMTTWPADVTSGLTADATSGATILSMLNNPDGVHLSETSLLDMAVGHMNGSLGEVGSIAILIGFAYLLIMRVITWRIPVAVLGSAALLSWILGGTPLLDLLSGGLLLGAVFMATDYVTSPMTRRGQLVYGILIGAITIIIRRFGAYPEGASFAILLGNSVTPLINLYCKPKPFGERRRKA